MKSHSELTRLYVLKKTALKELQFAAMARDAEKTAAARRKYNEATKNWEEARNELQA